MTKEAFLKDVANWDNHRRLLFPALEATRGSVVEFGIGHGSTPYLHDYCEETARPLSSYENNMEWIDQFSHMTSGTHKFFFVKDWDDVEIEGMDVLLIDHAPGERRWEDILRYANIAKYIVIHDSEPAATGYMLNRIWHLFKYRKDYETSGAWATVVSNFHDVTKWQI
jgi:hypothetical protein